MHPSKAISTLVFLSLILSCDTAGLSNRKGRINRLQSIPPSVEASGNVSVAGAVIENDVVPVTVTEAPGLDVTVPEVIPSTESQDNLKVIPLEDLRIETFYELYALYERAVGKYAAPGKIEWQRVSVNNWPETVSKSDLTTWTEDDVGLLNVLIEIEDLKFKIFSKGKRDPSASLTLPKNPRLGLQFGTANESVKLVEESGSCDFDSDVSSLQSCAEGEEVKQRAKSSSDEESSQISSFEEASGSKRVEKAQSEREVVLSKALNIYREDTGEKTATEIDWTIVREGPYAGATVHQLEELRNKLTEAIRSYTAAMNSPSHIFILKSIFTEILMCLELLLQYASYPPTVKVYKLSKSELYNYLEYFQMTMANVQPHGVLQQDLWLEFLDKSSEFRNSI